MAKEKYLLTCVNENHRIVSAEIHKDRDAARGALARSFLVEKECAYDSGYDDEFISEDVSADYAHLRYGEEIEYYWQITEISSS